MSQTVLAVDVGNTTTRFGIASEGLLRVTWEVTTSLTQTADEACLAVCSFFDALESGLAREVEHTYGSECECLEGGGASADRCDLLDGGFPTDGIISSVVPSLTFVWQQAVGRVCGRRPLVVGPGLKTGLKLAYNDPSEIGADRVADMIAVKQTYGSSVLVVDMGTSTNFELLNDKGEFAGGIIAPGLRLSASALAQAAARLPMVEIKAPSTIVGRNTREAMQSGIVMGEVARIDGLIDMIWDEIGYETTIVVAGPDAQAMAQLMSHDVVVDQTLTLRGLVALHALNRK